MPWLLFRYILRELLRILLVTSGVLVTVVAFGAAIKPLSDDQLLTASQAARYIVLAMVPMLQFALPFAAGFAATLLGHRMSSDNEVLAISAGGVSYRRLLAPIAGLGVVLLVVMLMLTQWVIPRFWGRMQRTISADVTRLFESAIGRGEPFALGNLQIYADEMAVEELPAGADADSRMVLLRVVAAELDRERRIVTDISAGRAELYIYRRPEDTYLKLVMTDTVVYNRETGQLARTDEVRPSRAIRLGRALDDEPVAMTRTQLLRVLENPDTFSDVVEQREALIAVLRDSMTQVWITARLAENGRIDIDQPGPEGRRYRVLADRMAGQRLLRRDGEPIVVEERREGGLTRRFRCRSATLVRVATSRLSDRRFELRLVDCEVESIVGGGSLNRRAELEIPGLAVSPPGEHGLAGQPSAALIASAGPEATRSAALLARTKRLEKEITDIRDEIHGRLQKRYALSVTAPLLLLLGATLAMWRRESLPLTIYLWAFAPSILDLIVISGGEQMMRDGRPEGVFILWSGNVILLGLCLFSYYKLSRH